MTAISRYTPQQLAAWRATLARRSAEAAREEDALRSQAMAFATRAAEVLYREFGAERVVLFGSLAHGRWFSDWSDVDLAAAGLDGDRHLLAIARLTEMAGDLKVDLVRLDHCSAALRATIDTEGRPM